MSAHWYDYCVFYRSDILRWDMDETAKGGPFQEILDGKDEIIHFLLINS